MSLLLLRSLPRSACAVRGVVSTQAATLPVGDALALRDRPALSLRRTFWTQTSGLAGLPRRRLLSTSADATEQNPGAFGRSFFQELPRRKIINLMTLPVRTSIGYGALGVAGTAAFAVSPVAVPLLLKAVVAVAMGSAGTSAGMLIGSLRSIEYLLFDLDLMAKFVRYAVGGGAKAEQLSVVETVKLVRSTATILQGPSFLPWILRPLWQYFVNSVFPISIIADRLADFLVEAKKNPDKNQVCDLTLIFASSMLKDYSSDFIDKVRRYLLLGGIVLITGAAGIGEGIARFRSEEAKNEQKQK